MLVRARCGHIDVAAHCCWPDINMAANLFVLFLPGQSLRVRPANVLGYTRSLWVLCRGAGFGAHGLRRGQ
jgi:hypothetical protein